MNRPPTTKGLSCDSTRRRQARTRLSDPTNGRRDASRRRWIVSVFGDISRSGSWSATERTSPLTLFGDIDLDLRDATLPDEVTITAVAPFGNIGLLVPENVHVDVGGFTLFGSKKITVRDVPSGPSAPRVRLRGFTLFGSLKVWSP